MVFLAGMQGSVENTSGAGSQIETWIVDYRLAKTDSYVWNNKDIWNQVLAKYEYSINDNQLRPYVLEYAEDSGATGAALAACYGIDAAAVKSFTAMSAVAASSTAMSAVAASSTAMSAVLDNSEAWATVVASSTAMSAVAASSTAMSAVAASDVSMASIAKTSSANTLTFWVALNKNKTLLKTLYSTITASKLFTSKYTGFANDNSVSTLNSNVNVTNSIALICAGRYRGNIGDGYKTTVTLNETEIITSDNPSTPTSVTSSNINCASVPTTSITMNYGGQAAIAVYQAV